MSEITSFDFFVNESKSNCEFRHPKMFAISAMSEVSPSYYFRQVFDLKKTQTMLASPPKELSEKEKQALEEMKIRNSQAGGKCVSAVIPHVCDMTMAYLYASWIYSGEIHKLRHGIEGLKQFLDEAALKSREVIFAETKEKLVLAYKNSVDAYKANNEMVTPSFRHYINFMKPKPETVLAALDFVFEKSLVELDLMKLELESDE